MNGRMAKRIRDRHGEKFVKYATYLCERGFWTRLFVAIFVVTHRVRK